MALRLALPLLLGALVVLAGCSAPIGSSPRLTDATTVESPAAPPSTAVEATSDTRSAGTPERRTSAAAAPIAVEGGRLAADPEQVFRRVTGQLGVDAAPPARIRIVEPSDAGGGSRPPPFLRVLGARAPTQGSGYAAQTIGTDLIRVNRSVATRLRITGVLAHEFTHVVQHRRNASGRMFAAGDWRAMPYGTEQRMLVLSVEEGAATYAADRYQRRYAETTPQGTRYERQYRQRESAGGRYFMAPYWFGFRYVRERVAGNGSLASVYDRPPRTTEAIIHRLEPGTEPPANLSVTVSAERWRAMHRQRVGELGTRIALSATLNRSRAAAGADGWGNDVLVPFESDSERDTDTGYVWVLRWDDAANESEFRAALTETLDRRGMRTETGWQADGTAFRVRQGDERTTVVVAGPSVFVENASAAVEDRVVVRGP